MLVPEETNRANIRQNCLIRYIRYKTNFSPFILKLKSKINAQTIDTNLHCNRLNRKCKSNISPFEETNVFLSISIKKQDLKFCLKAKSKN